MTTTEDERQAIRTRFRKEGLDDLMPDDKKLPHVWRWLCDAEFNVISMKKQNEKIRKMQEADLKEVEQYIESLWQQSNRRLVELQGENRVLKQEVYNLKLSKPTELAVLDIVNNNKKNLMLNNRQSSGENGDLCANTQQPNDQPKENKKSAFSNVKQMFIKNNKEQNANKQSNLENELRFMIDKCRSIENEKKRLEVENENLVFKLNETLAICDKLESSKTSVQMARNSKSFYELRQATSDYRLNTKSAGEKKLTASKTMNFQTINHHDDNKSTSGIESSSSQDKENELKIDEDKENNNNYFDEQQETKVLKSISNVNQPQDSGRETSSSTLTDSKESKDFKDFSNPKEFKDEALFEDAPAEDALHLLKAVREECAILKRELIAKEKQLIIQERQLSDLQLKYDKRKARHKDQMAKLKNHIERETKRWQKLFDTSKQKRIETQQNANLVDSL